MTTVEFGTQSQTIQAELLGFADQLSAIKFGDELRANDGTAWDYWGFDPEKSYLPLPLHAQLLVVAHYRGRKRDPQAISRAVLHIPGDFTLEVRAEDPTDAYEEDELCRDALHVVKKLRANVDAVGIQAYTESGRPQPAARVMEIMRRADNRGIQTSGYFSRSAG
ncbi:MAG: hypothetical protein JWP13_480 [Candidatus Saccharibacteria bacterium]|nr:hypothetical protein [Candidatus Saccharibacteria bacterium]